MVRRSRRRPKGPVTLQPAELDKMRAAGRLAARLLDRVEGMIRPGLTTEEIDQAVHEATRAAGAVSAPYLYPAGSSNPFPKHCCTSVNEVVCHGIPDPNRVLQDGDIINVDVTPKLDGFHGDVSRTFFVGEVSEAARRLVEDTFESMRRGIAVVRPGAHTGDIGHAIQSFVEPRGLSVVREFAGHGIGRVFHGLPTISHYGVPGEGIAFHPGMTFTIEPMINEGHWKTRLLPDEWTAVTADGLLSAQFEHTVTVTEDGVEVLTLAEGASLDLTVD